MPKIGVIVVHGVGEQKRFEFLESIACNLYRAVRSGPNSRTKPSIQLRRGDQVPHLSEEESWHESPAIVSWHDEKGEEFQIRFREVHWADLDMEMTWRRWFKLIGWSLSMSGVQLFNRSSGDSDMCPPTELGTEQKNKVRRQLFGVSLLFLLLLINLDLLYGLITRFGFKAKWLGKYRNKIYNYLGDVKLYQDRTVRNDDRLEVLGEKSRVAIRRRMVRALVQTAWEANRGELDGYFIWSHSLGTVVAFNGLMEPELALPNYLTREEWDSIKCQWLKTNAKDPAHSNQMPKRPSWLDKKDAISREELFKDFRGILTIGSPLDKFAALWPSIVLVNKDNSPLNGKPWINVADVQDIVAGSIEGFDGCDGDGSGIVGGLSLQSIDWAGESTLFSAHTSYWIQKQKKMRLIDAMVTWLESEDFHGKEYPEKLKNDLHRMQTDAFDKSSMKRRYRRWLPALGFVALWVASSAVWLLGKSGELIQMLMQKAVGIGDLATKSVCSILLDGSYLISILWLAGSILIGATIIIRVFSIIRGKWEQSMNSEPKASAGAGAGSQD